MTLYGTLLWLPQLKASLPRSIQAVKGWHKRCPGRTYPPLTWELTAAIAVQMARAHHFALGVGTLLAFDCLLRVGELCAVTFDDIADDGDARLGSEHKGMVIRLPSTKTGKNQFVTILEPAVQQLVRQLLMTSAKGAKLFKVTTGRYRTLLKATCASLGLSSEYVPHSLRHGGATRYRHVLNWSVESVMERGRWVSTMSARRYIQSGKALLMSMSAPPTIARLGATFTKDLVSYFNIASQ